MPLRPLRSLAALGLVWAWCAAQALAAPPPRLSWQPEGLLLGTKSQVELQVQFAGDPSRLRAHPSTGTLSAPRVEGSSVHYTWTPPEIRYPLMAVVMVWVEDGLAPEPAVARIPLRGRTDLQVKTRPKVTVRVKVGEAVFGPERANGRGQAVVSIEVPPGLDSAIVLAESKDEQTERTVPLTVPDVNPLAAVLSPDPIVKGSPAWLLVLDTEASPTAAIETRVAGGSVAVARSAAGLHLFRVTPQEGAKELKAEALLAGRPSASALARAPVSPRPTVKHEQLVRPVPAANEGQGQLFAHAGGVFGVHGNVGASVAAGFGYAALRLAERPVQLELEAGLRVTTVTSRVPGLGQLTSRFTCFPVLVAGRLRALARGPLFLDARVGLGLLPFVHSTRSDFQPPTSESALGLDVFVGALGGYRLERFELFAELRAAYSRTTTPWLSSGPAAAQLTLGGRYSF